MIAIVITSLGRGGAERSTLQLLEGLLSRGIEAKLFLLFNEHNEYLIPDNCSPFISRLNSSSFSIAIAKLFIALKGLRPKLIFSVMPRANLASLVCARMLRIPLFTSERANIRLYYGSRAEKYLVLLAHFLADGAIFISQFSLSNGIGNSWMSRAIVRKARVLHNPVPCPVTVLNSLAGRIRRITKVQRFLEESHFSNQMHQSEPLRLLLASRLVREKGLIEFIVAAQTFIRGHNVNVVIAGDGYLKSEIIETCVKLRIDSKVSLCGFVEDVWRLYSEADVVILSSESEGFGRVGFEAYLAGCLVIGTKENSFVDEIISDYPGWVVEDASFGNLEEVLEGLIKSTSKLMRSSDIEQMREKLSIDSHVTKFMSFFNDISD